MSPELPYWLRWGGIFKNYSLGTRAPLEIQSNLSLKKKTQIVFCDCATTFFFLMSLFIYLFIYLAVFGLRCGARASHCGSFACCGAWALGTRASVVVARGFSSCGSRALESRLSSCGARAYLLRSMWDLPRPGLEPVSPALAGGFLTTVPPGKSLCYYF